VAGSITASRFSARTALVALLIFAFGVRLGWVLTRPTDEASLAQLPDQLEYLALGQRLIAGQGLCFRDRDFDDWVYAYRTPGYPVFVAACGGNVRAVRIVQTLIDTSTVLAAYLLARRWLSPMASLVAAALVACNPFLVFFTGLILSETLYAAMLVWGMVLIVWQPQKSARLAALTWLGGAIVLVLSILVRPGALVLPLLLAVAGMVANHRVTKPYPSPSVAGIVMLVLSGVALLAWGYRNHRVTGSWIFTTTNSGITLYDGFNPDATGASSQKSIRALPQLRTMDEVERSEYLAKLAWEYIRAHPRRVIELTVVKVARTWSPAPLSEDFSSRRNVLVALSYMVPFYLLIVLGLWVGQTPLSAKVFLLLPAIYFTVVHALSVGSLRYRVPADVPMAIIAAAGVSRMSSIAIRPAGTKPQSQ
jgi:hypothetical protein